MNTNILGVAAASILIGLLLGFFAVPQMFSDGRMGSVDMRGSTNMDRHFIEEMIPHHEGAIAMAELALEKSRRPEILSLAAGIIEAQTREISDMTAWYQSWFGTAVPVDSTGAMGGMGHGAGMQMMGMEGDIETLAAAKDFDLEFLKQMIPHHEMAIMMARMLDAGTTRSEMKTLADAIITSQSREIEMMRSWLTAWY